MRIIGFRGCQISGFQPGFAELQQFFVADIDDNPMLCKHDSMSMGDCVFMVVKGITNLQGKVDVQFSSSQRLKSITDDVFKHFTVYAKDYAKSNVNTTEVNLLKNCAGKVLKQFIYSLTCDTEYEIKGIADVAIAYKGKQVSSGALMIIKEIKEMLENVETKNYLDGKEKTEFVHEATANLFEQRIKADQAATKLHLQVTAYSRCPDYVSFVY